MKRMLSILLLGLLIFGAASAAATSEYTLSPFVFDTQAMLALTFGDQADQAIRDDREYPFYELPDSTGAPFCGQDDTWGFGQMRFIVFTALVASENHEPNDYENVEPSGVAKCALTAAQAQEQAAAWLAELGVKDAYFQSVTAYGRISKLSGGYMIAFGQQADGLPVYWAAALRYDDMMPFPESNRIEVVVGDSGPVMISGYWSAFAPTRRDVPVISEQEAIAAFAAIGERADTAELCYLLTGARDAAFAIPAYRWQNRFIAAEDGKLLQ
jgi:hypothetical protein